MVEGDAISGAFDSMIAKVIVTGATREQAISRARRALAEMTLEGIPSVLPFHRAVLNSPAYAPKDPAQPFSVYTSWIESEFMDVCRALAPAAPATEAATEEPATERVVVEVGGKRLEVVIPAGLNIGGARGARPNAARRPARRSAAKAPTASGASLSSPMQGTIVKIAVEEGTQVEAGELIVVLEAMKMEQPLVAHKSGKVTSLTAQVGASVSSGTVICEIQD